jgi:hypothetical protein
MKKIIAQVRVNSWDKFIKLCYGDLIVPDNTFYYLIATNKIIWFICFMIDIYF